MHPAKAFERSVGGLRRGATESRLGVADRWLAARLQSVIGSVDIRLELWDGSSPYSATSRPIGDLIVRDRRTLLGLIINPELYFGEAYMSGRLDIRGAIGPVLEALSRMSSPGHSWKDRMLAALAVPGRTRRQAHSPRDAVLNAKAP